MINSDIALYGLLQTNNARVINIHCTYQIKNNDNVLTQIARCSGEIQQFGQKAPQITAILTPAKRGNCHLKIADFQRALQDILPTFRAYEEFCLGIRASEKSWIGVFGVYEEQAQMKISLIFPKSKKALIVERGEIPHLTPLASAPLPGQTKAIEALFIVASNRPALMDQLIQAKAGRSLQETMSNSVNIQTFDQRIGTLNLDYLTMRFLPYEILQAR